MNKRVLFWMTVILLVAAVLRLRALPDQPVGLHYDEAANVILSNQIAEGSYRPLFIRAYTGKEVLFFYAAAPWMAITGGQAWGIRLGAAMLGILTVALSYRAAKELTHGHPHSTEIALFTAAFMAFNLAHLILSRYGFRAIIQPLLQACTVALLWRGLRIKKTGVLIAAGCALGLTGYTYLAARMFPIPVAMAILVYVLRTPKTELRQTLGRFAIVLGSAFVAFAPLGIFFLRNPETFFTRINQVASTTAVDALKGIWSCVLALGMPARGDAYVRFNQPGVPILGLFGAVMALIGLVAIIIQRARNRETAVTKWFLLSALPVMLLPSALATSEITPSNLRLVGLFPFLMLLPAYGLSTALTWLKQRPWARDAPTALLSAVVLVGGIRTGILCHNWATSTDLFYNADGDMALAARALDDAAALENTTIYIASEHHQHPTVAALAENYSKAKWLTGGASLVLPTHGDALIIVPNSAQPPVPWDQAIRSRQWATHYLDPAGDTGLITYSMTEAAIQELRDMPITADFAHIVAVMDAQPLSECYAGASCPILLTWQVLAPTDALQAVVSLSHPDSGEWTRSNPFHYPADQWTVGDIVFDQIVLDLPAGIPTGDGYTITVGMFNPNTAISLPRLEDENFAGLQMTYPANVSILPAQQTILPDQCPDQLDAPIDAGALTLHGATSLGDVSLRPGEMLYLRLCWHTEESATPDISWTLEGNETLTLHEGELAHNETDRILEDRYALRIPRDAPAGKYTLTLNVDGDALYSPGKITVTGLTRSFEVPQPQITVNATYNDVIELLGLDISAPGEFILYWQSQREVNADYVVFMHAVDTTTGEIIAQRDSMPVQNSYGTSLWVKDEVIADTHTLDLNTLAPDQPYELRIGLYIPMTGDYLMVDGERYAVIELP